MEVIFSSKAPIIYVFVSTHTLFFFYIYIYIYIYIVGGKDLNFDIGP